MTDAAADIIDSVERLGTTKAVVIAEDTGRPLSTVSRVLAAYQRDRLRVLLADYRALADGRTLTRDRREAVQAWCARWGGPWPPRHPC